MTCETEFGGIKSNDRRCINYRRAGEWLAAPNAMAVSCSGGLRWLARICVCGSVRFRPEQVCAVTDSVLEQQRSVRSISRGEQLVRYLSAPALDVSCCLAQPWLMLCVAPACSQLSVFFFSSCRHGKQPWCCWSRCKQRTETTVEPWFPAWDYFPIHHVRMSYLK